jgi:hypothetical protein
MDLNETHDPQLASWVESANDPVLSKNASGIVGSATSDCLMTHGG